MLSLFHNKTLPYYLIAAIIVLYALLALPMIDQIGISFDEQTDLIIAQSYDAEPNGWLHGSNLDPTNVRLPMYLSWLTFDLTDSDLYSARLTSCILGIFTLVAIFLYCCREFSPVTGLAACLIMAISPYFLAFSKVAFTEGDIFITCFAAWLLYFVTKVKREPTFKWIIATGLCLGLVISAKASGAALVCATIMALLLPQKMPDQPAGQPSLPFSKIVMLLAMMTMVLVVVGMGYFFTGAASLTELPRQYAAMGDSRILWHYLLALVIWLLVLAAMVKYRKRSTAPWWSLLLILGLAAITFFVIPPVHITNPTILTSLADIFLTSSNAFSWNFAAEALSLHFWVLLLKSGIILGIGLWLGVLIALWRCPKRPALRIPLIFFLAYFAFLILKMVHAQTYFMMPLYPLAAIFLADLLVLAYKNHRKITLAVIVCGLATTTYDLIRTYPYVHLNGYQWVGERYLGGRSTLGYRSIAQTPSDGLEQALSWIQNNVPGGERLYYFTYADHIVRPRMRKAGILFLNGFHPAYTMDQANYVLIHINSIINDGRGQDNPKGSIYKYYYDQEKLKKEFRKVYIEKRPFGLEVASVWYRKVPYNIDHMGNIAELSTEKKGLERHQSVE